MSTAPDWDSFRARITDPINLRKFDRALSFAEEAEDERETAEFGLQRADRRLRRIVARITADQRRAEPLPPPVIVDPPPRQRPPVTPPNGGWIAPGMSAAPRRIDPVQPSRAMIDAEVFENGTWRIVHTGRTGFGMARDAYEAFEATLDSPRKIVLKIHGNVGRVSMGHAYSKHSSDLFRSERGWMIDVAFVGADDNAAVGPVFLGSRSEDAGTFDVCKSAHFFGVGINADPDPYAFRQHGYLEELIFDKVWINENAGYVAQAGMHRSAFLFHNDWEHLTLKGYEPRGMRMEEHVAYIQGGGFTQILDCNLYGGRRTGYQDRSHQDSDYPSPPRHGAFIADGNWAEGFGFNHSEASGGQWLTNWFSGEYPVRISNNRCTDARYGCLGIAKGVPTSMPYLTHDGLSHSNVYIWGNEFENKRAQRTCVSLADARMIHFGEGNDFTGPVHGGHTMVFGSQWGWKNAGAQVPIDWGFYGAAALPTWSTHRYMRVSDVFQLLTDGQHLARLVAVVTR